MISKAKIKLKKSKNLIIYGFRYIIYLFKLFVWKINHDKKWTKYTKFLLNPIKKVVRYFREHPKVKWTTIGSITFLAIIVPLFIWWPSIPKAPRLRTANNDYLYSAQNNIYTAFIGSKENNTPIIQYKVKGANVTFTPASGKQKLDEPIKEGKELTFKNVYKNIDYKYQTIPQGIKEEIVINEPTIIQQFPFYIDFEGAEPKYFTENLAGGVFYDEGGNYIFHFEKPYAVDANGERTDNVQLLLKRDIKTKKYVAIVSIDPTWSQAKERAYPIRIDPTVVHDTTAEFATGQLNRVTDTGSGSSPNLETYYQELPADEHTLGLWHLNESSDNTCSGGEDACDSSGNGFHATDSGSSSIVTGKISNGREFVADTNFLSVTDDTAFTLGKDYTVEAWINPDDIANDSKAITGTYNGSGFILALRNTSDNELSFWDGTWRYSGYGILEDGNWKHVAFTCNSGRGAFFVNGNEVAQITCGTVGNGGNLHIGAGGTSWSAQRFDGKIDEVRISKNAKSQEQIKLAAQRRPYSIYTSDSINLGSDVYSLDSLEWTEVGVTTGDGETVYDSTNLFAQWNFNETSGTTANNDAEGTSCGGTPSDCDGTLTNFDSTASQDADPDSSWTATYKRWGAGGLLFDNTDSYVAIGDVDAVDSLTAFSACAWVSHRTAIDDDHIIGKYDNSDLDGFLFLRDDVGQTSARTDIYKIFVGDSSDADWVEIEGATNTSLPGTWNFVCTTFQTDTANGLHLYVNGVEDIYSPVDTTGITAIDSASGNLVIGRYDPTTANYFSGAMDAVQLYGRVLSSSEILSLYNAGQAEFQTRTSSDDSSWEAWKPTTNETQILDIDSDATNWSWDTTATNMPKNKADESTIKMEGSGSMEVDSGIAQADANTVSLWHLDDTNGDNAGVDVFDATTNNNDGEYSGSTVPGIVDGVAGKARYFDTTNDTITAPGASIPTGNQVSVTLWAKGDSSYIPANNTAIIQGTDSLSQRVINIHFPWSDSNIYWDAGNSGGASYDRINKAASATDFSESWSFWAFTKNASTGDMKIYRNGVLWHSGTGKTRTLSTVTTFNIVTTYYGNLDEIKISNVELTADEVAEMYRAGSNHNLTRTISSTDLSSKGKLPYYIAADKPGTYLETVAGETAHSNNQPDANTSALLHLEEKSGSGAYLLDSSGNGYHGTPTNTIHSQGKIGKGRYFDGSGDYISLGNTLSPTTNFSVSAWVNPSSIVNDMQVVSKGYDGSNTQWEMKVTTVGGNVSFRMWNGTTHGVQSNNTLTTNVWTHLTGTYDGTTWRIYWNGILDNYAADTGPPSTTRNLYIGAVDANGTPSGFWNGQIDEVEISSSVRSASEIRELYEMGNRAHPVTIDFAASLDSGNLIANTSDTSFTVDATSYGLSSMGSNLFEGDKIIVREDVDGTEYIAQGDVTAVTASTGAVTIDAWDSGSTVPSGGYTVNATVFKWQREYWDISKPISGQVDAITKITLNITNGDEGRTIWLDDIESASDYLTDKSGSTITSTAQRYFQYKTISSSTDTDITPSLTSVTLTYTENVAPGTPTLSDSYLHDKLKTSDTTPEIRFSATDTESDDLSYKVEWDTDSSFPSASSAVSDTDPGFANITTPADTDPFNSGDTISYTFQTPLSNGTTYFYRVSAKDPSGSNTYGSVSSVKSLTIDTALGDIDAWHETHADQFSTDTLNGTAVNDGGNYVYQSSSFQIDDADTAGNWVSSDGTNLVVSQETTIKQEGTGSVKLDAASYVGDGSDGALNVTGTTVLDTDVNPGGFDYTSVTVSSGAVLTATGSNPLLIRATGAVNIQGTLHVDGGNGGDGGASVGAGGTGIAGGGGGGAGAPSTGNGSAGSNTGGGEGGIYCNPGGDVGGGGGGGSFGSQGTEGGNTICSTYAQPGPTYGSADLSTLEGGSGGGGGGGDTDTATEAGAGGGAGGGAVQIAANMVIVSGNLTATGGNGGNHIDANDGEAGAGAGGSGGAIKILSTSVTITGTVDASGGSGGSSQGYGTTGGDGGDGRIRIEADSISGSTTPTASTTTTPEYSVNDTATLTTSAQDLSASSSITFWVRSDRTGQFMRFEFGESASNEQTYNITVSSADTWEQKTWDISGISSTARDAVTKYAFKITNDDQESTIYFDDIQAVFSSGTTTSTAITAANIDSGQNTWGKLLFTDDETYGDIKYKVYYDVTGTPTIVPDVDLPGNSTGFDTTGVDLTGLSTSTYTILYAYAELTYSGGSPQLQDWTITMNTKPNAPTLDAPTGGTLVSTTPTMTLTATDPDTDNIQYKIKVCEDSGMTTNCQTYDQSQSQTGWSGQDGDGGTTYTSGTQGTYVVQSALSAGQVYYWEGYAIDPAGTNTFGTSPSAANFQTNAVPSAPTSLLAEGEAQPLFVTDTTPEFSAICNDGDVGQILNKYRIQVDDDSDFSSAVWDSGSSGTSMSNCTAGDRSSDISFGGTPLALDATTYYWRIKFWDAFDVEGVWSSSALFRMSEGSPTQCYIQESVDDTSLTLYWADNTSYETQFRIERNVSAAGFTFLVNEAADATSHEDTDITAGNTYQYRVRAENGGNSSWCTTETLDISAGTFQFQGLDIQGLDLE